MSFYTLPCSGDEENRMGDFQQSVLGIKEQTFFEAIFLEFFECCCFHFSQIDYKKVHEHVFRLRVKHNDV